MSRSHTSDPRPYRAALELWAVRLLTRMGVRISVRLLLSAGAGLSGGVALLAVAAIRAWGDAAVVNVRAEPGFFTTSATGLTNAAHLVLLAAIPPMLATILVLGELVGLGAADPGRLAADRRLWQSLALAPRHVVTTHEVLPRLPVVMLTGAPLAAVASLTSLTTPERSLAWSILALGIGAEALRVGVRAARIRWARDSGEWGALRVPASWAACVAVGVVLGWLAVAVAELRPGRAEASREVVAVADALVGAPGLVAVAVAGLAAVGGALLLQATHPATRIGFAFTATPAYAAPRARSGPLAEVAFPVAGARQLERVWTSPEVRWTLVLGTALVVARPDWNGLPHDIVRILAVTSTMAFCLVRMAPLGLTAGLVRLRHHAELGARPGRQTARVAAVALLAALPVLTVVGWALWASGLSPWQAVGLALNVVAATIAADAVVASAGAGLTEHRLLLIALGQSLGCLGAWPLYATLPLAGWLLTTSLIGGFGWMASRRQRFWTPRTPWPA